MKHTIVHKAFDHQPPDPNVSKYRSPNQAYNFLRDLCVSPRNRHEVIINYLFPWFIYFLYFYLFIDLFTYLYIYLLTYLFILTKQRVPSQQNGKN
jgi:hypothetical protein